MRKKISIKNYLLLLVIYILTILLSIFLSRKYSENLNVAGSKTVMYNFLSQINASEIDNYILENPNAIIYVASTTDESLNNFEEEFKMFLTKNDLVNYIVQVDDTEIKNSRLLMNIKNYPNIIKFNDGKIFDVLYETKKDIKISDIEEFFNGDNND